MRGFIGIDVGTTGVKALLVDEKGTILSRATEEYPLSTPQPLWAEQDPEDWWRATTAAVRALTGGSDTESSDILGIGLSGQMHGAVLLDRTGKVLRPCILWCDQRTAKQCETITGRIGKERLVELTCNPALTGFTAPKILWVQENEPAVFEKTAKILLPKDYIRYRLTGTFASEVSDASGTLLFDVRQRTWSKEVLQALDIDSGLLPDVFESPVPSAEISKTAARETGLSPGTPVVGGGGDQAAGAVGNGIVRSGVISSTLGTSGVVFASTDEVKMDPDLRAHTFCHAVPGKWHIMGVMLSAGGSFRWLRDTICLDEATKAREAGKDPYELITRLAGSAPAGSEGLLFLPYLTGERTPHADPDARGVLFGLTLRHTRAHVIRAVMEGIAYGLRDSLEILRALDIPIEEVRASGGGARSRLWRQIQADVNGAKMTTINVDEGPAFGAALLAGVGAKSFDSVEDACDRTIQRASETEPQAANVPLYDRYYRLYRALYPSLKGHFKTVSEAVLSAEGDQGTSG